MLPLVKIQKSAVKLLKSKARAIAINFKKERSEKKSA